MDQMDCGAVLPPSLMVFLWLQLAGVQCVWLFYLHLMRMLLNFYEVVQSSQLNSFLQNSKTNSLLQGQTGAHNILFYFKFLLQNIYESIACCAQCFYILFIQQQKWIILSKPFWLQNCKSVEILEIFLISPLRPLSLFVRKADWTTAIYSNTNSIFISQFFWLEFFLMLSGMLRYSTLWNNWT